MRSALPRDAASEAGTPHAQDPPPLLLDHLRHVARDVRCKEYVDMFGACAALSGNAGVAARAASEVLMRCLDQALGRRPILYREGEAETSFDEAWLLALARSLRQGDASSATFLLRSRVPAHARRHLVFLLRTVVDNHTQV
ncbi:MAG: hypothetical protein R6V26_07975 [Roseovarius sp.]